MVSQAELISKGYHSLVPDFISIFRDGMGPFNSVMIFWDGCHANKISFMTVP